MLVEYRLNYEVIQYIREQLSQGGTLARYLLQVLSDDEGEVKTYLPADCLLSSLKNFAVGGVTTTEATMSWLTSYIADYLAHYPHDGLAVFESLARSNDPHLLRVNSKFFTHDEEVYFFLTAADRLEDKIRRVIRDASQYPFIGVLTIVPVSGAPQPGGKVRADELEQLALGVKSVLIGAYDGEAVLLWDVQRT